MNAASPAAVACIKGYSDCEQKSVTRKIRDFAVTAIALLALFGLLLSINPDLRERVTRLVSDRQFAVVQSAVTHVATLAIRELAGFRRRQHLSLRVSRGGLLLLRA